MIELVAPKGLGDAIYLRAIVFHLLGWKYEDVAVYTLWPEVFEDLNVTIRNMNDLDQAKDLRAVAYSRRSHDSTQHDSLDQFRRGCIKAGLDPNISLRMFWRIKNKPLLDSIRIKAKGRKIMMYQPLKIAHHADQELLRPDVEVFNGFVSKRKDYFKIKIGNPDFLTPAAKYAPCDLDLVGKTSIHDVFDIAVMVDTIFCEPCFLVVLAEAMDKNFTCMFARKGLESSVGCIADVNPKRIFNKPHLATAVYDS